MQEQLINFETAKLAKEMGFDIETGGFYFTAPGPVSYCQKKSPASLDCINPKKAECYSLPQDILQKWLRERKEVIVLVEFHETMEYYECIVVDKENSGWESYTASSSIGKETYEDALEAGLLEALKLIKDE